MTYTAQLFTQFVGCFESHTEVHTSAPIMYIDPRPWIQDPEFPSEDNNPQIKSFSTSLQGIGVLSWYFFA